ncbi:Tyrosine--tRNA ligase, mitochondrial [Hanseniaspora osmophila]|uniref:Tyrosine--tRNA ligase n=1 Tax=Hanseniaspora osmophila TaxID=56408 RepID=A0A1E5R7J7_9ASCO|nr:Tyrosine--tRNA ligase, mitochondrial [Hanseniaspora osmophila]
MLTTRRATTVFTRHLYSNQGIYHGLRARNLISQVSEPLAPFLHLVEKNPDKIKLYSGADPTASSLHLGNLVPMMVMLHFYLHGHDIVPLIGGATGKVGDPSGRTTERQQMEDQIRRANIANIQKQQVEFFKNGLQYYLSIYKNNSAPVVGKVSPMNNVEWWKDVKLLDFLANYGKHIRVQHMLSRDSVASRLSSKEGLGFNEFTYQILQAYDFLHLNNEHGVTVQIGGNDQWGNITAGIDLIQRCGKMQPRPIGYGITVPLLTTANGEKFGKSSGNAVFIDPTITSPYDMYQYFINVDDRDVERFLLLFTLLPLETISQIVEKHRLKPELRFGQKQLAKNVVDLIHGMRGADCEKISSVLFNNEKLIEMTATDIIKLFESGGKLIKKDKSQTLIEVVSSIENCSRSEVIRKLKQSSIYLGPNKFRPTKDVSDLSPYLIEGRVLILRVGKSKVHVIKVD